jgi:competence protein ComEA
MPAKIPLPPPVPLVVVLAVFLGILLTREASTREDLPHFSPPEEKFIYVELSGAGLIPGVYQFYDGCTLQDVINLTEHSAISSLAIDPPLIRPLLNGQSLRLVKKDRQIEFIHNGWIPASQRIALGIPLHPDRMNARDWQALPGVGPELARRIENDRQKNGEFGRLDTLHRVPGIGGKRIDRWKGLF